MPDNDPGEAVHQEGIQQVAPPQVINPPASPDNPHGEATRQQAEAKIEANAHDIEDRIKHAERWMIGLTIAIAFFALCSVVVGVLQWLVMSGQLGEMKSGGTDTKNLAIAAGNQAVADRDQVTRLENLTQATKDAMAIDQRAWLTVNSFGLPSEPQEGKEIQVTLYLQNTGKTPALDQYTYSVIVFGPPEPPLTTKFTSTGNFRNNIIPPGIGNASTKTESLKPSPGDLKAYVAKTAQIYVHGRISYTDVFGNAHWTSVCAFHNYGDALASFNLCSKGNDVDRDQKKKAN